MRDTSLSLPGWCGLSAFVFLLLVGSQVRAQATSYTMPIMPGPMSDQIMFMTLVGPPEEGWITQVTMNLVFQTSGSFDAADLELDLSPPVEPNFPEWIVITGQDLGWSGQGTFTGTISTTTLNGHMQVSPLFPQTIWNLDIHPSPGVGGGVSGNLDASTILVEYTLTPPGADPQFVRGDCNDDGQTNVADAIFLLAALFPGPTPVTLQCEDSADANDDGVLNIADAIALLESLFGSPAVPLPPPAACDVDPTDDGLGCTTFTSCP